jgi:hypothetical protein|tara:strand:+ start:268 stop:786 length:519 start_codon:yes stop_codon:yes gene_type:complete
MKVITYIAADGGLAVTKITPEMLNPESATRVTLANEGKLSLDATEAEAFAWAKSKSIPAGSTNVREIEEAQVPTDRSYRDSWEADGATKIKHNMPKARDIHRDKMRAVRAPKLTALDIDYQRADETGDTVKKSNIVAAKVALRDVTAVPEIEAATDIDGLKTAWPDVLVLDN